MRLIRLLISVNLPAEDPAMYMDLDSSLQANGRYNFLDSTFLPVHSLQNGENLATTSVNSMPDLCISDKINTIKRPSSTDILLSESSDLNDCKDSPVSSKPEFLSIAIVKGAMGFGFTIADSAHGQKVKKILDRQRCKNLMEGDILVNINDINVRNMCHSEVVQVLKDCPRTEEALIHVQRTTTKSKEKKEKNAQDFFRSKTPTADIYSTQSKTVIPSRPKTPLIDTRNRSKSPANASRTNWNEVQSENELNPLDGHYKYSEYSHGMYYSDPYKANITNLSDNFAAMMNLDDDSVRNVPKRDWSTGDKLNINNDMYSIDISHHDNMLKQNGGCLHSDYYKDLYAVQSHSQYNEDYNAYSIGQEQNVDTGEIWDKRKETTSFEHEQPHSSSIPRYVRFLNDSLRYEEFTLIHGFTLIFP